MKRLVLSLVLISLVLTSTSFGAWKETFTGGFDRSDWYFTSMNGGSYTQDVSTDLYRCSTVTYPTQTPKGADQVVGVIPVVQTDFTMGAWFNKDATQYNPANPYSFNDSSIAMLGRADLANGNAYGIGFNRSWGHFRMIKMVGGVYSNMPTYYDIDGAGLSLDAPYYVNWTVTGNQFTVQVFDENYVELNSWTETDDTFTAGTCGILTYLTPSVAPRSPLAPYPSLMNATLDDVSVSKYTADFNCDGEVGVSDYLILAGGFGGNGHQLQGDATGDGLVSFSDYLEFSTQFGSTGGTAAVPEPISLAILGLGAMLLRRKH